MNPPSAVPTEARPIDASERLVLLDVLRGFALCGVFVSNVYMWFSGRAFLPRAQMEAALATAPWWEQVTMYGVGTLVFGKFITLFSFLFGLGFSVQMIRAEARGDAIAPLYRRRLYVMMLIGLVHLLGFWYGDILTTYATLGFALLLFRTRTDKTLLIWAAVLTLVAPVIISVGMKVIPHLLAGGPPSEEAAKAALEQANASRAARLDIFLHGDWFAVVATNARYFFGDFGRGLPPVMLGLLGRFLLGFLAGRRRLFHDAPQHLPFFRKLLRWSLLVGGLASAAGLVLQYLIRNKLVDPQSPWMMGMMPVRQFNELGLAAVYASGIVLLFQREAWQRVLRVLAPVGRMALTNYLSQTVLSVLMYYGLGLGLMGKLGPTATVALTLAVFSVQVAFSHWWLARFRFGPAEWVWRSLTYGKAQPMRLATPSPDMAVTAG